MLPLFARQPSRQSMASKPLTLAALEQEHLLLTERLHALPSTGTTDSDEATLLWTALGIPDAQQVPELSVDAVRALRTV